MKSRSNISKMVCMVFSAFIFHSPDFSLDKSNKSSTLFRTLYPVLHNFLKRRGLGMSSKQARIIDFAKERNIYQITQILRVWSSDRVFFVRRQFEILDKPQEHDGEIHHQDFVEVPFLKSH